MSRPAYNGITGNSGRPSGIKKRKADDDLGNEQRLAKRFDLLNLEQNGKLYVPVQSTPPVRQTHSSSNSESESMQLDDTKDRVYIHNLDEELADIESEEEKLVFLPDIEKKLAIVGNIPKSVLLGEGHPSTGHEVVLYSVPSSISVPEDQDKVRKAIIESRARAREKQLHNTEAVAVHAKHIDGGERNEKPNGVSNLGHVVANQVTGIEKDEDAMDLG